MEDDQKSMLIAEPEECYYADDDITVTKYETKNAVVYKLPKEFPKDKHKLRRGLEEIIGECARDSRRRILSASNENIFPEYVLDTTNNMDYGVLDVIYYCDRILKTAPFGRKVRPIAGIINSISFPGALMMLLLSLLNKNVLPQTLQSNAAMALLTTAFVSGYLKLKYETYNWEVKYLGTDRLHIIYNEKLPGVAKKIKAILKKTQTITY